MSHAYRHLVNQLAADAAQATLTKAGIDQPTDKQYADAFHCARHHVVDTLRTDRPDLFNALLTEARQHAPSPAH